MTDLIPRDAAIMAIIKQIGEGTEQWVQGNNSAIYACCASLRAIPTIDPAAIREAALREAAAKCADHAEAARRKLGASETREDAAAWALIVTRCDLLEEAILALIGEKK